MPRWRAEAPGEAPREAPDRPPVGTVAVATGLAALPGLALAALATHLAAPDADALRVGTVALAALPLLVVPVAWAVRRVPPSAPRIAASCGAAPLTVLSRVWLTMTWRGLAAGIGLAVLAAVALARTGPAGSRSVLALPLAAACVAAGVLAARHRLPRAGVLAAAASGASPLARVRLVVLPALAPLLLVLVLTGAALAVAWPLLPPSDPAG
jgi:ABC-type molybdate transport system permease subunit